MYQLEGKYCLRNEQYFPVYRGINQKKGRKTASMRVPKSTEKILDFFRII